MRRKLYQKLPFPFDLSKSINHHLHKNAWMEPHLSSPLIPSSSSSSFISLSTSSSPSLTSSLPPSYLFHPPLLLMSLPMPSNSSSPLSIATLLLLLPSLWLSPGVSLSSVADREHDWLTRLVMRLLTQMGSLTLSLSLHTHTHNMQKHRHPADSPPPPCRRSKALRG